jgi:hypothetical protein
MANPPVWRVTIYEYLYLGYSLVGCGFTGEIGTLFWNGVQNTEYRTITELLARLGAEGWDLKGVWDKGEQGTYERMVFQRRASS